MEVKKLNELIDKFIKNELPRLNKLEKYYKGEHNILAKKDRNEKQEDTKSVNNYAFYITSIATAYFLGKPVSYTLGDITKENDFKNIDEYLATEEEQLINFEHSTNISIYGKSYELWYVGADTKIRNVELDPKTVFLIRDNSVNKTVIGAVRFEISKDKETQKNIIEVYDNKTITTYKYDIVSGQIVEDSISSKTKIHGFNRVPIIEFRNNKRCMGDFERVMSLIDSYNEAVSTSIDDLKDFSDAYLMLKNMGGTDGNDIKSLKENKVLLVEENGDAKWLIKNVNDAYSQNIKNRLNNDIHKFSLTPDMTDEKFAGNSSGVALGFKLLPLEQLTAQKEMYFKKAINERLELIINHNNFNIEPKDIKKIFTRNTPQNLVELSQVVSTLNGTVSLETLLSLLPFIESPEEELDKIKKETDTYTNYEDLEGHTHEPKEE